MVPIAQAAGLAENTTRDYLALLEAIYVVNRLPNWRPAFLAKTIHRPKLHAVDTGLACDALGLGVDALARPDSDAAGPLLETFVANELTKQLGWSEVRAEIRHLRDGSGREIDLILSDRSGRIVAIEVKPPATSTSATPDGWRGCATPCRTGSSAASCSTSGPGPHPSATV